MTAEPSSAEDPTHFAIDWLAEHGDLLFSYAISRVGGDSAVAEDLIQETLLAAIKAYPRFQGKSRIETWLVSILRHKIIDRFRVQKRREAGDTDEAIFDDHGSLLDVIGWSEEAGQQLETAEFAEVFDQCLAELAPQQAEAFTLAVMDNLPTQEVCSILGITPTNLSVRLHRARVTLRKLLQSRWFEGE
ncbi:MAG: sigma-70 family RNA polymerase sigma factor [Planctomycetota bacterium]